MPIIQPMRIAAGLLLAVAALLAFSPVAGQASERPATPGTDGHTNKSESVAPGSLTGAQLEGRRLTITATCDRDGRIEARAGLLRLTRDANCRRGHTHAAFRLPHPASGSTSDAITVVVRASSQATRSRLRFSRLRADGHARSPAARSAQFSDANSICLTADFSSGGRAIMDIGLAQGASFGLRYGTSFAWETWIYFVNVRTGASGYQRYRALLQSYAGAYRSYYQRWYPNPGFWIQPMIHVTGPGISLFDSVPVNGGFPYPARTSQWCMW